MEKSLKNGGKVELFREKKSKSWHKMLKFLHNKVKMMRKIKIWEKEKLEILIFFYLTILTYLNIVTQYQQKWNPIKFFIYILLMGI